MISNKFIDKFPLNSYYTPYNIYDFNNKTREFCNTANINGTNIKAAKVIVLGDVSVGKTCLVNR